MPLALWLMAAPLSGAAGEGTQLPGGSSAAFRQKMMTWSAEPEQPARPVQPVQRTPPSVKLPRLSSGFGYRSDPLAGTQRMHAGIDIPGPPGTPVHASGGGVISFAGRAEGYGNMIEIDHGGGLRTRYAHLSQILVRPGMPIGPQQTIALMGSTGRSTGSHLHFEVRTNGRARDPLAYLRGDTPLSEPSFGWRTDSLPHISQFARLRAASRPEGGDGF
ncbi:MAG: M23 family metallopeptidase [Novosphingobium sp.]